MGRPPVDIDALAQAVRANQRAGLAKAITLVESTRTDHREAAQRLLLELLPESGKAHRVGITGVPGVGKSTFIDALGMHLIGQGHRVAVLAVDPSSTRTGGSILGDKTRMARLTVEKDAYIRPSPTSGTLGGVAKATRETIVLLEAAGFDVILVETVGVGQSEVTVANMVDCFCFLTLARTGDQLQGIKKGVLELADLVAVNKADGKHEREAKGAARELAGALRLIYPHDAVWTPPVITMSGLEGVGLEDFWNTVCRHREVLTAAGQFEENRRRQQVDWTWTMVNDQLLRRLASNNRVKAIRGEIEQRVRDGSLTAALAAAEILDAFDGPDASAD
ncbi:methylmalonyl Co-A mutase-associated GTPase MeaB [Rhodococcus sp. WB9]|uniref:methylmalonyl Co-A mutase-associated GTPase MeaB n=1 Tax=Rhodococcus sp. WB9 TaxID=2594007 RepID=UPI001185F6CA|nr:methylmalonyl Co-A mutase-associated GTPase MeaB [Rhodococcus sp. WB9]QDQ92562.1 methylmalonyl Co-A mutase-associated GTPase MeaB [Rhodococcus sp. WB9]